VNSVTQTAAWQVQPTDVTGLIDMTAPFFKNHKIVASGRATAYRKDAIVGCMPGVKKGKFLEGDDSPVEVEGIDS